MSDMIERVAKAIHAVEFEPGDAEISATMQDPSLRRFRLDQTRAAIAAMREPPDSFFGIYPEKDARAAAQVRRAYERVIDAILAEPHSHPPVSA